MSGAVLQPDFIDSAGKRIFVLLRVPEGARQCVLFVPPFAEEMNKCRRQFTHTAQALLRRGLGVLTVDLFGTGDSEGEFSEASWLQWKSDVESAARWVEESDLKVDSVVACRLGCALAAESLRDSNRAVVQSVFWQPVVAGRQFTTQFLRLRVAASMMESDNKETVADLRGRLDRGETLEVAGYELSPELASAVETVNLNDTIHSGLGRLTVFEVGGAGNPELSRVGQDCVRSASSRTADASGIRIAGEPFWTTTEIVVNPELVSRTTDVLAGQYGL